ncbi:GNAT family N-acetyltransferase [Salinisphaera sp. T31B1]|uniref:GNAT family N-acetyltransferase n=1 Tax=Salinisphaera sp. T31B1 TaxID=727963 RepID=UPI00333F1C9B
MTETTLRFRRDVPAVGELCIRPLCLAAHAACVHHWLASDHARFWGMQSLNAAAVASYLADIETSATRAGLVGLHQGSPAFYIETYDPAAEPPLARVHEAARGDRGMHILIAPPSRPIHGFTWAVFALTMDYLFADPRVERVVVEPDIANRGIHALNRRAGFVYHRQIELPDKTAWLATCTREAHARAMKQLDPAMARLAARHEASA